MNLSVTNNGTGNVSLTVTGAAAGSFVSYWPIPKNGAVSTATLQSTYSVPISAVVETGTGLYQFAVSEPSGALSVQSVFVTNGESVATRVREAIATAIESLNLSGIVGVYRQWNSETSNLMYPCIVLTVEDVRETDEANLSTLDRIGYPVHVIIADRVPATDHTKLAIYERWRQSIARTFRRQRVTGVPESYITQVEFDSISNPETPKYNYMVSELVIRAVCRENRGIGE